MAPLMSLEVAFVANPTNFGIQVQASAVAKLIALSVDGEQLGSFRKQQCLDFMPDWQGQGSLRPTLGSGRT